MRSRNSATSPSHVAEPLPTAAASTLRAYHRTPRERLAPPAPRCSAPTPQRLARGLDELRSQVGTGRPHDGVELGVDAKAPEDCRLHQQRRLSFRHAAPLDRRGRTSRPTFGGSSVGCAAAVRRLHAAMAPRARLRPGCRSAGRRSTIALVTRCRQLLFEELPYLLDPRVERFARKELIHVARVQRVDCLLLGDVEELRERIRPGVDSVYGRTKRLASSDIPMKRSNGSSTLSAAARCRIASTLRSGRGRDGASACSSVTSRISSLGPPANSNTSKLTTSIDILKRPRNSCMRSRSAVTPTPTSATAISRAPPSASESRSCLTRADSIPASPNSFKPGSSFAHNSSAESRASDDA